MQNGPVEESPKIRELTSTEARDIYTSYRESGIPLPEGVLGIGVQRIGTSGRWSLTVYATTDTDASEFISENFMGLPVVIEEPGTGEAY